MEELNPRPFRLSPLTYCTIQPDVCWLTSHIRSIPFKLFMQSFFLLHAFSFSIQITVVSLELLFFVLNQGFHSFICLSNITLTKKFFLNYFFSLIFWIFITLCGLVRAFRRTDLKNNKHIFKLGILDLVKINMSLHFFDIFWILTEIENLHDP